MHLEDCETLSRIDTINCSRLFSGVELLVSSSAEGNVSHRGLKKFAVLIVSLESPANVNPKNLESLEEGQRSSKKISICPDYNDKELYTTQQGVVYHSQINI